MMYKVVIVEDEPLAVNKLKRLLAQLDDNIDIVDIFDSNQALLNYLEAKPNIDVIFSDIELVDGPVFNTYQQITPQCPIIFVTAYNQFMMDAFDSSGIAYLLKPFSLSKLERAWQKYLLIYSNSADQSSPAEQKASDEVLSQLNHLVASLASKQEYSTRFAIKSPDSIYFLSVDDITYIQADGGVISAFDIFNKRHFLPFNSLQKLELELNPKHFFRLNRSEFVQQQHIEKLERYSKNSLMVYLKNCPTTLVSSQSKTADFAKWLGI